MSRSRPQAKCCRKAINRRRAAAGRRRRRAEDPRGARRSQGEDRRRGAGLRPSLQPRQPRGGFGRERCLWHRGGRPGRQAGPNAASRASAVSRAKRAFIESTPAGEIRLVREIAILASRPGAYLLVYALMSASGSKQTYKSRRSMSAFGIRADIEMGQRYFRF